MRTRHLLLSALALALAACDDGESLDPDMTLPDTGPSVGRDMRLEAGPIGEAGILGPRIDVTPDRLSFLADPGERSEPVALIVTNTGTEPLTLTAIRLDGAPDFEPSPVELPVTLAPAEAFEMSVVFAPDAAGDRASRLVFVSDDPAAPEHTVDLAGRNPESCVRAMPSTVNLGSVAIGAQSARFRVQLVNCGDRPATIGEIALDDVAGFEWEVVQGEGAGQILRPGSVLLLAVWYTNSALSGDDMASTVLRVPTDLSVGEVRINVTVRGGGGPTCEMVIEPAMVDYETLRIGLTRPVELTVANRGTAACELRDLSVMATDGAPENGFQIVRGLEGEAMAGGAEQTIEVAYAPEIPDPVGDRAELRLSYHDPHRVQNRTATALLRGVGAQAQIGAAPPAVQTGVTTAGCASWRRTTTVSNVGFVPICVTGFDYLGAGCERFAVIAEPSVPQGECVALERGEGLDFTFRHTPAAPGTDRCTLVVESDAQNTDALQVQLDGQGTDTAATVDEAEVGDLDRRRNAYFSLSRPCDEATLRLFVDGEETEQFDFSEQRNALVFEANRHPADEGAMLRMEYDAVCYEVEAP